MDGFIKGFAIAFLTILALIIMGILKFIGIVAPFIWVIFGIIVVIVIIGLVFTCMHDGMTIPEIIGIVLCGAFVLFVLYIIACIIDMIGKIIPF